MAHSELNECPACGGELLVREYVCPRCELSVRGLFRRNPFSRLSLEAQEFLLIFVKNRGNLREIERELGISYPTVRNRLDRVIEELGLGARPQWTPEQLFEERRRILDELKEGRLTPEEAEELLWALRRAEEGQP
ncbi:MAG: hypothetical protein KatS3mg115_2619 [Candidatus Poribacteria bacterium]|nr:MAG: hypothetical protein KatS3mg115_2619 [Candidatus Poribacteria bacterium]